MCVCICMHVCEYIYIHIQHIVYHIHQNTFVFTHDQDESDHILKVCHQLWMFRMLTLGMLLRIVSFGCEYIDRDNVRYKKICI